jgi:hypothetical protein
LVKEVCDSTPEPVVRFGQLLGGKSHRKGRF